MIRLLLCLFPRGFRERQGRDLVETYLDLLEHAEPCQRSKMQRRALGQILRAALLERLASLLPAGPTTGRSHENRSSMMDDLLHDLKYAYRSIVRRPGFALIVMLTLAIGIGSSAAMFGVVYGVLLEPLPYEQPERLVSLLRVFADDPGREADHMSLPDLEDVREQTGDLEALVGYLVRRDTLLIEGEPELVRSASGTEGLLEVMGTAPHLGRDLSLDDARSGAPRVVVLSHDFWTTRYGADPHILGATMDLSGRPHEIVGVAPSGFVYPPRTQIWTALHEDSVDDGSRGWHFLQAVGRVRGGTEIGTLNQELSALGAALEESFPESNTDKRFAVRPLRESQVAPVRGALWMLLGAVQLVVLIASANVANLILVRGSRRRREMAIRGAVGAGRGRIFRQLILESFLLAAGGAALGWGLGLGILKAFVALAPRGLPRLQAVALDGPVLLFTAALTLIVLFLFGLAPAWRAASKDLRSRSAAGLGQGKRWRLALLTSEVALALVLLLGAGLLLRSFMHLTAVDLGYEVTDLTRMTFLLPEADYPDPELVADFSARLEARIQKTPGVEAAGLAFAGPFGSARVTSSIAPLDRPEPAPNEELSTTVDAVSPGFFGALGLSPVRGRFFTEADIHQSVPAIVISQGLADRYFPGKDPVGERAHIGFSFGFDTEDTAFTIIGVAPDIRAYSITEEPRPAVYMAQAQSGERYMSVLVRNRAGADVVPAITEHFRALDPVLPVRSVRTQEATMDRVLGPHRFYLSLLTAFAVIALVLSAIGLYAVISYLVSERTRELAIRMALGADAGAVLRLVLLDALRPAALGVALGLGAAFALSRLLESLLHGIQPHDALTYAAAPAVLLLVASLAALVPARRAARLQPRVALEEE